MLIVDLRINETPQTGAVENRTYQPVSCNETLQTGAVENRTYGPVSRLVGPPLFPRYAGTPTEA